MQDISHTFHFVSDFTLINPPGSQSPLINIPGKIEGGGRATDQSQPPSPLPRRGSRCLCLPPASALRLNRHNRIYGRGLEYITRGRSRSDTLYISINLPWALRVIGPRS